MRSVVQRGDASVEALVGVGVVDGQLRRDGIQVGLSLLSSEESTNLNTLMAASAIVIIPVVVLYLILQRRFIDGVAGTGLKG